MTVKKETVKKEPKEEESSSVYSEETEEEAKEMEPEVAVRPKSMPAPAGSGGGSALAPAVPLSSEAGHPPPLSPPQAPRPREESEETEEAARAPKARSLEPPRSPSPRAVGATPKSAAVWNRGNGGKGHSGKGGRMTCHHCWKPLSAFKSGQDQHAYWSQYCLEWQFKNIGYTKQEAARAAEQLKQERLAEYEDTGAHVPFPADPFYGERAEGNHGRAHVAHDGAGAHLSPAKDRGRRRARKAAASRVRETRDEPEPERPVRESRREKKAGTRVCETRREKDQETRVRETRAEKGSEVRVRETRSREEADTRVHETRRDKKLKATSATKEKADRTTQKHRKETVEYVVVRKPQKKRKQKKVLLISSSPSPEVVRIRSCRTQQLFEYFHLPWLATMSCITIMPMALRPWRCHCWWKLWRTMIYP